MKQSELAASILSFVQSQSYGTLATTSIRMPGYPFGSLTPYILDEQGQPVIFIATISEHFRNLEADPRASILIPDAAGTHDPQAHARAALVGTISNVEARLSRDELLSRYFDAFPKAPERSIAHTFAFFGLHLERIRWIGGFGSAHWLDAEPYFNAATA